MGQMTTIARLMNDQSQPAPLWRRLAAALYDLFPLIGLWMLVAALGLLLAGGRVDVAHPPPLYHLGLQLALLGVTALYFVLSWCRGGQTIGMRAWRLQVMADEAPLGWPRALLRFGIALLSLATLGLGFLWCLVDREQRAWHDIASGTRMVQRPR